MLLRYQRKHFYEVPLPARECSPHGLMFRLVFAVYPVNITAAALQVSGKVECVSDEVFKHITMSGACWAIADLFLCLCVSLLLLPAFQQWRYHQH